MTITLRDLVSRLQKLDEITLLEVLDINAEELTERFMDKVEEKFEELSEEFEEEEE